MGCGSSVSADTIRNIYTTEYGTAVSARNRILHWNLPKQYDEPITVEDLNDQEAEEYLDDIYDDEEYDNIGKEWHQQIKLTESFVFDQDPKTIADENRKLLHKKFKSDDPKWNAFHIFRGNPYVDCWKNIKVVRIFTSSTFTDTRVERNTLMEIAYPKLKDYCNKYGYDFQIVDMRWGVRSEATDDHLTTDLCLAELKLCQQVSTGPNFVTFLSHKYGFQPIPRVIEVKEFETIIKSASSEDKKLILDWYLKDENAVPDEYVLQPISTYLPNYLSPNKDDHKEADKKWSAIFRHLQKILQKGVEENVDDPLIQHKYHMSVTEIELVNGIIEADKPEKHCFWFKRNIKDIVQVADKAESDEKIMKRFYDGRSNPESVELMQHLVNEKLPPFLPNRIKTYDVPWQDIGINIEHPEHKRYIDQLKEDFVHVMEDLIQAGIKDRKAEEMDEDMLYFEVVQHVNFCREKSAKFYGRVASLQAIKSYIKKTKYSSPLIIHGDSGCGKTSLLAKAASLAWGWMDGKAAVVYRFIGTTPASSSITPLLSSVRDQLIRIYNPKGITTRKELEQQIKDLLGKIPASLPLVFILDSLDQMDNVDSGKHLQWLPSRLPPNVKVIVSTQVSHPIMSKLKTLFPSDSCYVELDLLNLSDIKSITASLLKDANRKLTQEQEICFITACTACPLPLFLELSFDEALHWHSYDPPGVVMNRLQTSVHDTINALYERLEKLHGIHLVRHLIGCLTTSQNGLSEGELEDILSLNDDILNDVYQFHVPPIRRLPPLLAVRIQHDLKNYIVNRGVDGVRVIYWFHNQFMQTAKKRYLQSLEEQQGFHQSLADFFVGKWAERPKPYLDKEGQNHEALRYAAKQPLAFADRAYNKRKLMQLPYHLIKAGQLDLVKEEVFCNYEFMLTKLQAVSLSAVQRDLLLASSHFPDDQELLLIKETLQLSQDGIMANPNELAGQLIGRIPGMGSQPLIEKAKEMLDKGTLPAEAMDTLNLLEAFEIKHRQKLQNLHRMLDQASQSPSQILVPHQNYLLPPGGQLKYKLAAHTHTIKDLQIKASGKIAVTGSFDKTVKLWDVESGEMIHLIELPQAVSYVRFCNHDNLLIVSCPNKCLFIVDIEIQIGNIQSRMIGQENENELPEIVMPIVVCQNLQKDEIIVAMRNTQMELWSVKSGERIATTNNYLDDWSVHNKGRYIHYRHLVSSGSFYVYSNYRASEFFIANVNHLHEEPQMVEVFEPYDYNIDAEEPDFTSNKQDNIGAIGVTATSKQVVVSNGKNQNIILFSIENGTKLQIIEIEGNMQTRNIFIPPGENWFYFSTKNSVGLMDINVNSVHSLLPHNCRVYQVVGIGERYVITTAEDNVLRIWDRKMDPYMADISQITGKVNVASHEAAAKARTEFEAMFSSIVGSSVGIKTQDLLTTEVIENYWTKKVKTDEFDDLPSANPFTQFHQFKSSLYVGVTQSDVKTGYAFAFSVWETVHVTCVRRLFFPHNAVYVYTIVDDKYLLLCENRRLKLLDLIGNFKVCQIFQGKTLNLQRPIVVYNNIKNVAVTETSDGLHLKMYNVSTGKVTGLLKCDSDAKQVMVPGVSLYTDIKFSKDGKVIAAWYAKKLIYTWNAENCAFLCKTDPNAAAFGKSPSGHVEYEFHLTTDGSSMVLVQNRPKATREAKNESQATIALISTHSGMLIGYASPKSEHEDRFVEKIAIIQSFKDKYLQIICINKGGKAHLITKAIIGRHSQCLKANDGSDLLVTWGSSPKEKTIRYWQHKESILKMVGSFTPDKEVTDVGFEGNGTSLLLNSPGGIIKLLPKGKDVLSQDMTGINEEIFLGNELELTYEVGNKNTDELAELNDQELAK